MKQVFVFALAISIAVPAAAGPLTPPGAPAPTMKTLDEVEARTPIHNADIPLTITQPGSYYLAENITSPSGTAITINASNVTINLNGFTMHGPGQDASVTAHAIFSGSTETSNTIVQNGIISNWPDNGILLNGNNSRVENVHVSNCDTGIDIDNGSIHSCQAEHCNNSGIYVNSGLIKNCVSKHNLYGITAISGVMIQDCFCNENQASGIISNLNAVIIDNHANSNGSVGIYAQHYGVIQNNQCNQNDSHGIYTESNALIKNNECSNNGGSGIQTGSYSRVESNHVINNTSSGIIAGNDSIVIKNTAGGNSVNYDPSGVNGPHFGTIINLSNGASITSTNPWANFEY